MSRPKFCKTKRNHKKAFFFPVPCARRMATMCYFVIMAPLLWGCWWGSAIGDISRSEDRSERLEYSFPTAPYLHPLHPYQVVVSSMAEIPCSPSPAPAPSLNGPPFIMTHSGFGDTFPSSSDLEEGTVSVVASVGLCHHPRCFHSLVNSTPMKQALIEALEYTICVPGS